MTARDAATRILATVRREDSYSNVLLDSTLQGIELSAADRALTTRLVYGVIERRITLDYYLSVCSTRPLKKLHPLVVDHLRVGAYQILYMERIPFSAAVNEAVNAVKRRQPHAAGFVNGVLHALIQRQDEIAAILPAGDEGLSVRYSCPVELIRLWREAYGDTQMREILCNLNGDAPTFLRVNTLRGDVADFLKILDKQAIDYRVVEQLPACVEVFSGIDWKKLAKSAQNWYYHQDMASQYAVQALRALPGERIADVCAAPGGKSLTTAQYMQNRGEIVSSDIYPAKCREMSARAVKYGATIIKSLCRDASIPPPAELTGTFDRVICDAPCSGLGVIRRRPEIRYKDPSRFAELAELQYRILMQAAALVRPGGVLQYSTCTLNPLENEAVAQRFLKTNPAFRPCPIDGVPERVIDEPDWCRTLFPSAHGPDGFFIAGFVKDN